MMKLSISTAAALLSFVAGVASSAISSSATASPSPAGTSIEGPFSSSLGITTVSGSVAAPSASPSSVVPVTVTIPTAQPSSGAVTISIGATQTVTIPGDCVCPSGTSISSVLASGGATTVTLSSSVVLATSFPGGIPTSSPLSSTPSTIAGTDILDCTNGPITVTTSTFGGATNPVTVISFTSYATGTPVAAITSYLAGGTPVTAITSYFATATPGVTTSTVFATPTAAPVGTSSSYETKTVTVVSSSVACTCPQSTGDPQKLNDTSAAMSRGVRAEGIFAVAVAGVFAALI